MASTSGIEPDGGGVDQDVGVGRHRVVACQGTNSAWAGVFSFSCRTSSSPRAGERLTTVMWRRAGQRQLDGHGPRRAARAQEDDPLARRVHAGILAHRAQEALAVGVLADQPVAVAPHGVDRADQRRVGRDFVQMRQDRDLVRDGQVDAPEVQRPQPGHRRRQVGRARRAG